MSLSEGCCRIVLDFAKNWQVYVYLKGENRSMKFQKLSVLLLIVVLLVAGLVTSTNYSTINAAATESPTMAATGAADSGATITWAFVPAENSQTVLDSAQSIADLVSAKTGFKIKTVVATEYAGVIEAMCNGQADMGALNTFGYVLASSRKCADVGLVSVRNKSTS